MDVSPNPPAIIPAIAVNLLTKLPTRPVTLSTLVENSLIGFTLNAFLSGFMFGLFFYKKKITFKRVLAASICNTILFSFILTPMWLNMMYGSALISTARMIKAVACFPVNTALLYLVCKTVETVRIKSGAF